jgi:hypothetical protein
VNQRYDVFGFGAALLAAALFLWLGLAGPIFQIDWKLDAAGLAAWIQAIVLGLTIVGIYVAARIPIRAQMAAKEREDSIRAGGVALLIIPELVNLLGAMQVARESGSINDPPVLPSKLLIDRADQLYLLGETGGRVLQTIGLLSGMAAQTERYRQRAGDPPRPGAAVEGARIWIDHRGLLDFAIMNTEEAVKRLQEFPTW